MKKNSSSIRPRQIEPRRFAFDRSSRSRIRTWTTNTKSSSASRFTFSFRPRARCSRGAAPISVCRPIRKPTRCRLGLPGTLPVMNRKAFDLALKTALALHAEIAPFTKWDRKNYYYPDLPKNYQISQYDLPFSRGGHLEIPVRKDGGGGGRCRLTRIHLEEDTGKLTHGDEGFSEVDLNRAGIPLLEIVTEPDIRSCADARGCLEELKLTLRYLEVSDCEMQEGSLRCDANVNLHITKDGQEDRHADRRDQEPQQLPGRREGPDLRSRSPVSQMAGGWPDDQGRPQNDARLERRRGGHQTPAREGDGRRLSLFPRARPGPGGRRRALAGSHPAIHRRASRDSSSAIRDRIWPIALRRQRPGRAGPGRRRLLRRGRQGHRASSSWRATGFSRTCSGPSRSGSWPWPSSRFVPKGWPT